MLLTPLIHEPLLLSLFMASNTAPLPNPTAFVTPLTPRRRKHPDCTIATALRRRCTLSRNSGYTSPVNFGFGRCFRKSDVTARKLAAGLWQLRFMEVSGDNGASFCGGGGCFLPSAMSKVPSGNVKITFPNCHNSKENLEEMKDQPQQQVTILRSRNGLLCELVSSLLYPKCSKEEATKWDPADVAEPFSDFTKIPSKKLLKDTKLAGDCDSMVTALLQELLRAKSYISNLKAAKKSSMKKVELFLQQLEEEKVNWKHREHQKIQVTVDDLKDKLAREMRSRERMELLNAKLLQELAEANSSAKQFMKNYDKEKKERVLMEEVCNELAMQIGEERVKLEELLRDSSKICEEVQEERKMMQLVEMLREERVQMKLVDAKLLLEDKYNQMVQLIAHMQMFLKSRGAEQGTTELEDAQLIKKTVESVNIQRIVELCYDFSKTDETLNMLDELTKDNAGERVIIPYSNPTLTGPVSTIHIPSFDEEDKSSVSHQPSPSRDYNSALKLTNFEETNGHVEDQMFSSLPQRRDTDLINVNHGKNIGSKTKCSEKTGVDVVMCCVSVGQSKRKVSTASELLRPCSNGGTSSSSKASQHRRPGEGDGRNKHRDCAAKQNLVDVNYGERRWRRLSAGSAHQSHETTTSRCKDYVVDSLRGSELLGDRKSGEIMNPHITRGMKGCIEWPRGIPKATSKVIPLEERVRSQNSQMQNIHRPKA